MIQVKAFHLDTPAGRRFCLLREPAAGRDCRGVLVHVHAFAEEMNKSRRMVAQAARAMAEDGWGVLQIDLAGCGDSSGDFADARWNVWVDDVLHAERWAAARFGSVPWLWGLRAGALIAVQAAAARSGRLPLLLWQPVSAGRVHLHQFLRIAVARDLGHESSARTRTPSLRDRLRGGEALEVAGYRIHPSLADGLESAQLSLGRQQARVVALEVAGQPGATVSPAIATELSSARSRGVEVDAATIVGAPFWQTVEIEDVPALAQGSVAALRASREAVAS